MISERVLKGNHGQFQFFRTMGLMESGPDALLGLRLHSSFMMPDTDIVISGMG